MGMTGFGTTGTTGLTGGTGLKNKNKNMVRKTKKKFKIRRKSAARTYQVGQEQCLQR